MPTHRFPARSRPSFPILAAAFLFLGASVAPAAAHVRWLPKTAVFPRNPAAPHEARSGLTYLPYPDRFDAALGSGIPLAALSREDRVLTAVLETGVFFRLGKQGTFFPLQTFDGLLGFGFEASSGRVHGRLRLMHWSGHRADGDPDVTYRGCIFSREFWSLEVGTSRGPLFLAGGVGSSWHAVPADHGAHLFLDASWQGKGTAWRPFLALHLASNAQESWRVTQSLVVAAETGSHRTVRLGLRYFDGNDPRGQFRSHSERFLGLDLEFSH